MASDNTTVVAVHAENNGMNSEGVPEFSLESSAIEGRILHMNVSSAMYYLQDDCCILFSS